MDSMAVTASPIYTGIRSRVAEANMPAAMTEIITGHLPARYFAAKIMG